jgi:Flp pilus assembly protein protease CpaA
VANVERQDVSNWVVAALLLAAIVLLVALAQGTPDHARDRGDAPTAVVATSRA